MVVIYFTQIMSLFDFMPVLSNILSNALFHLISKSNVILYFEKISKRRQKKSIKINLKGPKIRFASDILQHSEKFEII